MSAILDNAKRITIDTYPTMKTSQSVGGYYRSEQTGPSFFRVMASLNLMTLSEFILVQQEIMNINYGIATINTTIPGGITYFNGNLGSGQVLSGAGRSVTFDGVTANALGTARPTDYIQFEGDTKVYQVTNNPISTADGQVTLDLNTDLVKNPVDNNPFVTGAAVDFKLQLMKIPDVEVIPVDAGVNYYQFTGQFEFMEVL